MSTCLCAHEYAIEASGGILACSKVWELTEKIYLNVGGEMTFSVNMYIVPFKIAPKMQQKRAD